MTTISRNTYCKQMCSSGNNLNLAENSKNTKDKYKTAGNHEYINCLTNGIYRKACLGNPTAYPYFPLDLSNAITNVITDYISNIDQIKHRIEYIKKTIDIEDFDEGSQRAVAIREKKLGENEISPEGDKSTRDRMLTSNKKLQPTEEISLLREGILLSALVNFHSSFKEKGGIDKIIDILFLLLYRLKNRYLEIYELKESEIVRNFSYIEELIIDMNKEYGTKAKKVKKFFESIKAIIYIIDKLKEEFSKNKKNYINNIQELLLYESLSEEVKKNIGEHLSSISENSKTGTDNYFELFKEIFFLPDEEEEAEADEQLFNDFKQKFGVSKKKEDRLANIFNLLLYDAGYGYCGVKENNYNSFMYNLSTKFREEE